jgi:hypothetical protein
MGPLEEFMGAAAQSCSLKDWAALISALTWPSLVAFSLVYFRSTLTTWVSTVTNADVLGFKLTRLAETTKTTTEALLSTDDDFDKIQHLLDWNKVAAEVRRWASEKKARNPSDMGVNNFRRFLFDTGLPGGKKNDLQWESDGTLKYQ